MIGPKTLDQAAVDAAHAALGEARQLYVERAEIEMAIRAYLSAAIPEDTGRLVEQLEAFAAGCRRSMWQSRDETIGLCERASSALLPLAAGLEAVKAEYAEFVKQHEREAREDAWQELSCDDQFRLATRIAGNVGYSLIEDEEIDAAADITKTTVTTRNEEGRFSETINVDAPYVIRELHGGRVDILLDVATRRVIGYRLYDDPVVRNPHQNPEVT